MLDRILVLVAVALLAGASFCVFDEPTLPLTGREAGEKSVHETEVEACLSKVAALLEARGRRG